MWPYLLLTVGVLAGGLIWGEWKKSRMGMELFYWASGLAMIAMASMRSITVGGDNLLYSHYFSYVCTGGWDYVASPYNMYLSEPGYALLNYAVSLLTRDYRVLFGVLALLTVGLRLVALRLWSVKPWLSLFLYVSFGFFGYALCTLRQELAISIYFFAFPYLRKGKFFPYLLLTLLAASFHNTLLLMLPVYLLARMPLRRWTLVLYGIGAVAGLLLAVPMVYLLARFFAPVYLDDPQFFEGRNLQTAVVPIGVCLLALFSRGALEERGREESCRPLLHFSVYSAILFAMTLEVFLYQRVALLFFPFSLYLVPELVCCRQASRKDWGLERTSRGSPEYRRREQGYLDARFTYRAILWGVIVAALLYQLFLLFANRLGLVPYRVFWQ